MSTSIVADVVFISFFIIVGIISLAFSIAILVGQWKVFEE